MNNPAPSTESQVASSLQAVVSRFRTLEHGETICEGDEFLEDDAETWRALPAMWWGTKCNYTIMQPLRRKTANITLTGDPKKP